MFIVGIIGVCQFAALVKFWPYDLSLSLRNYNFNLMDGGDYVELSGWTYKPELVPDYLRRLQNEASFQNSRFGDMAIERVSREQTTALRFNLGEADEGGS